MPFFVSRKAKGFSTETETSAAPRLAASIEVAPGQVMKRPELLELIPPATRVAIVDLGALDSKAWARLTLEMVRRGLEPVPHIAARRISSLGALDDRLAAMVQEAGVRDVLVIAGEAAEPAGPFTSSLEVLESGLLDKHGIRRIAVAGHPGGSPVIKDQTIEAALRAKQTYRERTDADMRILTQFGFDAAGAIRWSEALAAARVTLPIHLGVAGPASIKSLLKYAQICGVKASSQFLAKRGSAVTSLMTSHSPEPQVAPVEAHVAANPQTLIQQFHVFPFGGIAQAAEWLTERGSWAADARAMFEPAAQPVTATKTSAI
jgi:methylenetetrahydrofolate reductase (NADPH)